MRGLLLMVAAGVLGMLLAGQAEAARWTYPGDIASHLANGHGVSAAGMTRGQAEALHDRLHEQARGSGGAAWSGARGAAKAWIPARRPVTDNGVRGFLRGGVFGRRGR